MTGCYKLVIESSLRHKSGKSFCMAVCDTNAVALCANDAYSKELGKSIIDNKTLTQEIQIRRYAEAELEKRGLSFSRFKVARQIMNDFQNIPFNQLPADFVQNMDRLFSQINWIKLEDVPHPVTSQSTRRSGLRSIFGQNRTKTKEGNGSARGKLGPRS